MESSTDRKLLDLEPPGDERMEQMVSGMLEELMTTSKKGTTVIQLSPQIVNLKIFIFCQNSP